MTERRKDKAATSRATPDAASAAVDPHETPDQDFVIGRGQSENAPDEAYELARAARARRGRHASAHA
jgi:hypothetical protein